jgi:diguanylate cyclase (GGDEF)-like protein
VACGAVAFVIGESVLAGWALDVPLLLTWFPGYVTQKANTAICFIACAVALLARLRSASDLRFRRVADIAATVPVVVGGLSLVEYVFGWNLGIDQLLVDDPIVGSGTSHPGRMAPNSAIAFILIGVALLAARNRSGRARRVAQGCTLAALFLVLVALVGYAYGAHVLVGLFSLTRMAIHTITAMVALGVGTLWLTHDGGWLGELTSGGGGGRVARRLLPAALLIPVAVGLFSLSGYRAGFYDPAFGAALMAVAETTSFATLVWMCARSLNDNDRGVKIAAQDELTGILNRRGFLLHAEERRLVARRLHEDALIVFIDLDGMKTINDQLGHAAGDRALVETARMLRATFRDGDVIARLGGDEFAVFASRATMQTAPWMLSRLDGHLARLNAEPGRDFTLKLSTGVSSCLAADDASIVALLELADALMYEQKAERRASTVSDAAAPAA